MDIAKLLIVASKSVGERYKGKLAAKRQKIAIALSKARRR